VKVAAGLDEDSCRVQGLKFCRIGQSAEGRWAVAVGSGSCTETEVAAAIAAEIGTVEVVAVAELDTVGALVVVIELVWFGNFRTDSSTLTAPGVASVAANAGLA
jgi:hypothetical protein